MLRASFCCFQGVSDSAEHRLWQNGCLTWRHFEKTATPFFSSRKQRNVKEQLRQAEAALDAGLADWFLNRLPPAHKVRVIECFAESAAFLDIETTGLSARDDVTTIAMATADQVRVFVQGRNLHEFLRALKDVSLLVTFNGARFDLPFLRRRFSIDLKLPHLDLMPVLQAYGYRGGLKVCEKNLQIKRCHSSGVDGAEAVRLWNDHQKGNIEALRQLILYNAEDAVVLQLVARELYRLSMLNYPIRVKLPCSPNPAMDLQKMLFEN